MGFTSGMAAELLPFLLRLAASGIARRRVVRKNFLDADFSLTYLLCPLSFSLSVSSLNLGSGVGE